MRRYLMQYVRNVEADPEALCFDLLLAAAAAGCLYFAYLTWF